MPRSDIGPDLRRAPSGAAAAPPSPIERKLIAWSFVTGLALLVILAAVNHYFPPTP